MKLLNIDGFDVLEADNEMTWDDAMALPAIANEQQAGGFSDWVLPDLDTLKSLRTLDGKEKGWFWSSSPDAYSSNYAWGVGFGSGNVYNGFKDDSYRVRLVRAGQCLALVKGTLADTDNAGKDDNISVEVVGMISGVAKIATVLPDFTYDIIGEVKIPSRISVKIGDIVKVALAGTVWTLVA